MTITITPTSATTIEVRLSETHVDYECSLDVIADVNRYGNWVRGLELLGSGKEFSLQRALATVSPKGSTVSTQRPQRELTVTYDEDVEAGFLYLPYARIEAMERELRTDPFLLKCWYSIEDEKAVVGLAADKTLVFLRFVVPPDTRMETFLHLFGSEQKSPPEAGGPAFCLDQ